MNENTFASRRTHTRVKFSPLTVSCQLVCVTPQSPAAQTVNTLQSPPQYEPNRALSPTAIFPDVRAVDPDNIFPHGPANKYLSLDVGGIAWYVNEQPIADVWEPDVDFTIDQNLVYQSYQSPDLLFRAVAEHKRPEKDCYYPASPILNAETI